MWVQNHVRDPRGADPENDRLSSVTTETAAQPITPSQDAIRRKSQFLPRNHQSIHASLLLLAHILEAKGEIHIAAGYKALLPEEMSMSQT